ncbi:dual specificity mitogen-activated protein kinase kinase 7-like [Pomacea canaliculata]|uniref:dual specificity mitogen-activated protein kinase kinase 7-like n=1 Tax=Pomacea canaliculata TaxID=400727 RepID=UPI000D7392A6|nr:dual specificity mitogen-activated protein kinase kinase 7-like [Pomacea canaliculata]
MSTSSFLSRLDDLQQRLMAENRSLEDDRRNRNAETGSPSPRRPRMLTSSASEGCLPNTSTRSSSAPSSGRRRPGNIQFDGFARSQSRTPHDSAEIDQKIEEIMKQSGILTLNGQKIRTDVTDMESLGELGHGTCGQVVRMRHKPSSLLMAVKQMRRSGNREENKRIIMDLDVVIKSHDCPYIVQCVGTFITKSEVWICMELMSTCLDKLLKRTCQPIPEKVLGKMAVSIVKALHYLKERHGVIHRDVKPSNMLLDAKGTVKLCDFGISGRLVDSKAKTRSAGCAAYMAPERIDPPDPTRPDYDIRADVWSLGISLVELATGEFPYKNCRTDFEVLTKVLQEDPPQLSREFSADLRSFVKDCLTKDYKRRPKYKRLLEHGFIRRSEAEQVDMAAWFADVSSLMEVSRFT